MKKIIVTSVICCSVFAAYVFAQNKTPKQKTIEPCCCKHSQQIAEDIHWIREQLSKPYKAPPDVSPMEPINIQDVSIEVPKFDIPDIDTPNYRTPKKPKQK
jgi:hypothetical protein